MSDFFSSRWVKAPAHVRELPAGLPRGFRAAGVACGIKESGALDLGLLVSDGPATTSAARFTRSGTQSAPVLVCLEGCRLKEIRAVVVNSGNANAATGTPGFEDAARMQSLAADACGLPPESVAVASTGVIGVPLPRDAVTVGIAAAGAELRTEGDSDFAQAIRTTDTLRKHISLEVMLEAGPVTLSVQCKGAGMISPAFATLLCFVQTDAALLSETCGRHRRAA